MVFTAQLLKNRQDVIEALQMVYNSFISEKIDDYNSSVYYENPSYLYECFVENKMLQSRHHRKICQKALGNRGPENQMDNSGIYEEGYKNFDLL